MHDSVSLNEHRKEKPTIHPDRLMKLPDLMGYIKLPGVYPMAKVTFKIHDLSKVAEGSWRNKHITAAKCIISRYFE